LRDRVFLDANVLFSAAWRADSGLLRLWRLDVVRVTSSYALEEALRNLDPERRSRLRVLRGDVDVIDHRPEHLDLPAGVRLPADDRPILGAAIAAGASHLLSGDRRAFGELYGRRVEGVLVLRPAAYLRAAAG
jgi:hypothetical protein